MKPEMAQRPRYYVWELSFVILLVVLSCLGAWLVSHDCRIVFMTVIAVISVVVIMTPHGKTVSDFKWPFFRVKMKRES